MCHLDETREREDACTLVCWAECDRTRERARNMAEVSGWREKDLGVTSQGKVFNLMDANIPTTDVR